MSRRISTKAAESGQTTEPAADAIAPRFLPTAAEEHHTVVEPKSSNRRSFPNRPPENRRAQGRQARGRYRRRGRGQRRHRRRSARRRRGRARPRRRHPARRRYPARTVAAAPAFLSSSKDSLHLYLREVSRFPCSSRTKNSIWPAACRRPATATRPSPGVLSPAAGSQNRHGLQRRWMQNVLDSFRRATSASCGPSTSSTRTRIKFSIARRSGSAPIYPQVHHGQLEDGQDRHDAGPAQAVLQPEPRTPEAHCRRLRQTAAVLRSASAWARSDRGDAAAAGRLDMSSTPLVGDESGSATRMDFLPALGPH